MPAKNILARALSFMGRWYQFPDRTVLGGKRGPRYNQWMWLSLLLASFLSAGQLAAPPGYRVVGKSLLNLSAPGAPVLGRALAFEPPRNVLGIFDERKPEVINAFARGTEQVSVHLQAMPFESPDAIHYGGYIYRLDPDGQTHVDGSGTIFKPITPRVARMLHRYFGVSPAEETRWGGFQRRALALLDRLAAALHL